MKGLGMFLVWACVIAALTSGCAAPILYQDDWPDYDESRDARIEACYTDHPDTCMCATEE